MMTREQWLPWLEREGLDAVLLLHPVNRRYAAGFSSSAGAVLLCRQAGYFLTDFRYIEAARQRIGQLEVLEVNAQRDYTGWFCKLLEQHQVKTLGFEENQLSFAEHQRLSQKLPARLQPMGDGLVQMRRCKTPEEIAAIRRAQGIGEKALEETLNFIRPGVTEQEIAARLTYEMLRRGAAQMSFDPIVASGANGSMPHAVPTDKPVQTGEMITMDFGCVVDGYCSDMTRTVAVGAIGEEQEKIYQTVLQAQLAGIAAARAGVTGAQVDGAARQVIEQAGYGPCFGHSFGHGVGLEVHEAPNASPSNQEPLRAGEVISAEPGIYVAGQCGVRIEDLLVIGEDGCENLNTGTKELIYL